VVAEHNHVARLHAVVRIAHPPGRKPQNKRVLTQCDTGPVPEARRATMAFMASNIEPSRSRTPVVKKVAAGAVLIIIAALVAKLLIGCVIAVFWVVVVVAVIAAVLWALKTIIW